MLLNDYGGYKSADLLFSSSFFGYGEKKRGKMKKFLQKMTPWRKNNRILTISEWIQTR